MSQNDLIRKNITNKIVSSIESGGLPPWRQTWKSGNAGLPKNGVTQRSYSGINPMLLTLHQTEHGYMNRYYATYNQWASVGAQVQRRPRGAESWGCQIVFCRPIKKQKVDRNGNQAEETFYLLRNYFVFNVEQTVGGDVEHLRNVTASDTRNEIEVYEEAEQAIMATNADIRHGGGQCFYDTRKDYIRVPHRECFDSEYYASICHELIHWTEHKERLNWDRSARGEHAYAEAELIAEIGACYMCSELNVPPTDDQNHCSYIAGWLSRMKQDSSFLFRCSSQASKATDYLLSFSRQTDSDSSTSEVTPAAMPS